MEEFEVASMQSMDFQNLMKNVGVPVLIELIETEAIETMKDSGLKCLNVQGPVLRKRAPVQLRKEPAPKRPSAQPVKQPILKDPAPRGSMDEMLHGIL